jgi:hypothetical protein
VVSQRGVAPSESPPFFAERARTVASCALVPSLLALLLLFFYCSSKKFPTNRSPTQLARCSPRRLIINLESRMSDEMAGHTTPHGLLQFSFSSRGVKSDPNFLNGRGRPNRTQVPSESLNPFFAERARTVASCALVPSVLALLLFFFTVLQKISPLCTRSPTQLARCSPRRLNVNQSRISNEHTTPYGLLLSSSSRSRGRSRARAQRSAFEFPVSTCTKLNPR